MAVSSPPYGKERIYGSLPLPMEEERYMAVFSSGLCRKGYSFVLPPSLWEGGRLRGGMGFSNYN